MTLREAVQRVGLAGRELGSGPAAALDFIFPNMPDQLVEFGIHADKATPIALGILYGLTMAEDSEVMQRLDDIESEWRKHT